jgi:hypothetical protein
MASTVIVLAPATYTVLVMVALLILRLLLWLGAIAATSLLAKRNGQKLKKMSWSFLHGYTAEYYDSERHT